MAGRFVLASAALLAAVAFLLLFGSGSQVEATTYKIAYNTTLGCTGWDGDTQNSCTPGTEYAAGSHADLISDLNIGAGYSQFQHLATEGTPSTWHIAMGEELPNGAFVGTLSSITTLGLLGGACEPPPIEVNFELYDCSTDNSPGNQIAWDEASGGKNLLLGHEDGLPAGCRQYPAHVDDIVGGVKPRLRYFGFVQVRVNMTPTQIEFVMFNPEQLSQLPLPEADFIDDMGYINYVILDNPNIPAPAGDALDELCTPMATTTNLFGRTAGEGVLSTDVLTIGDVPNQPGSFWSMDDPCGNSIDDDGDTSVDEMCGLVRVTNPPANSGIYGTGSHLAGAYSDSYRDADGDTIPNNQDECPFTPDWVMDTDGDFIDDACEPSPDPDHDGDQDNDGWRNQQDNCPLANQAVEGQANDADHDSIGDKCDLVGAGTPPIGQGPNTPDGDYLNDALFNAVCIGEADTDGDGWCDTTETLLGSCGSDPCPDPPFTGSPPANTSTPEYYGIDFQMRALDRDGDTNPDPAPQSCDNWHHYDVTSLNDHGGVAPATDEDGDTVVNANDPGCTCNTATDADCDGEPDTTDNCPNVANPTQLDTDGDCPVTPCTLPNSGGDACDPDDDGDKQPDTVEWAAGSDPKNVCSPVSFDLLPSPPGTIDIFDVSMFSSVIMGASCNPPADYSICEATYQSDLP